MTIVDRIDELEVGVGSAAFWGLGQVATTLRAYDHEAMSGIVGRLG